VCGWPIVRPWSRETEADGEGSASESGRQNRRRTTVEKVPEQSGNTDGLEGPGTFLDYYGSLAQVVGGQGALSEARNAQG
jgi:hypothetical protein